MYFSNADFKKYVNKYCHVTVIIRDDALGHVLVREVAKEYMHTKIIGGDYRQQIMEKFLKME